MLKGGYAFCPFIISTVAASMIPANTVKQSPAFLWFSPSELASMFKRVEVHLSTCAASSASPFRENRGA